MKKNLSLKILLLLYGVGIAGHLWKPALNLMFLLTPVTLLITSAIVLYPSAKEAPLKNLLWMLSVFAAGFIFEVIGVNTNLIFGAYVYGNVLGVKIYGVPPIIGLNWVCVALGSLTIAERIGRNKVEIILIAGLAGVLFDFIMEPAAMGLGYWSWAGNSVPFQNYAAWFLITSASALSAKITNVKFTGHLPAAYLAIQSVFFLILRLSGF